MTKKRLQRFPLTFFTFLIFGLVSFVNAQPMALSKYIEGTDYKVLPNAMPIEGDKLQVMEFFWYGCSHCEHFEPLVQKWRETAPDDVEFKRLPAVWRNVMKSHAKLYYLSESLDVPHEIHGDFFKMLVKNRSLEDPKKFAKIFKKYGVEEETFNKAYSALALNAKITKAKQMAKDYRLMSTPLVIVNGKYLVQKKANTKDGYVFEVVDFLLEKERSALNVSQKKSDKAEAS